MIAYKNRYGYNILLLLSVFVLSPNVIFSQSGSELRDAIFFELGGNAYYYSVNYERQSARGIAGRVGVGYLYNTLVIPLTIGKVYGKRQHHFEIAGGLDLARNSTRPSQDFIAITGFIGYRYQKSGKKLFFKSGFTPVWQVYESDYPVDLTDSPPYPWAGIAVGSRF